MGHNVCNKWFLLFSSNELVAGLGWGIGLKYSPLEYAIYVTVSLAFFEFLYFVVYYMDLDKTKKCPGEISTR